MKKDQSTPVDDDMFIVQDEEQDAQGNVTQAQIIDAEAKLKSRKMHWCLTSMISGEAAKVTQTGLHING